jgi:hypothetical protein
MNAQREGSNIKIDIRLQLLFLGRNPKFNFGRMTIRELKEMRSKLAEEVKAKKVSA